MIEAFFYLAKGSDESRDKLLGMHRKFTVEFGLSADQVPVLVYDPVGSPLRPFRAHSER